MVLSVLLLRRGVVTCNNNFRQPTMAIHFSRQQRQQQLHFSRNNNSSRSAVVQKRWWIIAAISSSLHCAGSAFSVIGSNSRNMSITASSTARNSAVSASLLAGWLEEGLDNSWMTQLSTETKEHEKKSLERAGLESVGKNNVKRPIFNGHYVTVEPTPLQEPRLVIHSPQVSHDLLGLTPEIIQSQEFVEWVAAHPKSKAWATPYALSIMGTRYTSNCPYGTGDGYGDGRALSIAEIVNPNTNERYELQLKGAGPTPFCRGADGRAVLRSSIREFLASEAMHNLQISTTRALSLVVSPINTSNRPWYSSRNTQQIPDILNDARLVDKYTLKERKQILAQIQAQTKNDPDQMVQEPNAITCRVSPSFVRIGHFDLFARRASNPNNRNAIKELKELFWHACYREFKAECYDPYFQQDDVQPAAVRLLELSMDKISDMAAGWIQVGFAQGNFNADNCLIAGRTMDYGPFGFMDAYHPLFAKWTGSGNHFGFLNQPNAGFVNFNVLLESIFVLLPDNDTTEQLRGRLLDQAQHLFEEKVNAVFRNKLGFTPSDERADDLWDGLEPLLRETKTDWTIFWRQLTYLAEAHPPSSKSIEDDVLWKTLTAKNEFEQDHRSPYYDEKNMDEETKQSILQWLQRWRKTLSDIEEYNGEDIVQRMKNANPKYTLREWMLVEAYSKATPSLANQQNPAIFVPPNRNKTEEGDESMIHELFELIQNPYDEGTPEQEEKYYRRAPDKALVQGGTAFMS